MAANRNFQTSFWDDPYVASLPVEHCYLYLYLKLNKYIQTSGCCELKELQICVETGLHLDVVRAGLDRLESDGKIKYQDGWLAVSGEMQDKGKKLQAAADIQLAEAPAWVGEFLVAEKEKDERATHPAIVLVRDILDRFPQKKDWDLIIELLGNDFDEEYLRECQQEWARRGYNPHALTWLFEWYQNRSKPGTNSYGKRTNTDTIRDYYKEFAS